jgi:hypothetical protein
MQELFERLKAFGKKNVEIERDLGLPKNCFSTYTKNPDKFPKKHRENLEKYVLGLEGKGELFVKQEVVDEKETQTDTNFKFPDDLNKIVPEAQNIPASPVILDDFNQSGEDFEKPVKALEWVKEVEDFCNAQNITPKDLIDTYLAKKNPEPKKITEIGVNSYPDNSPHLSKFQQELRNKKLGIKQ